MYSVQIKDVEAIDLECTTFCNLRCPECNRERDKRWISGILNTSHMTGEQCKNWFRPDELINLTEIRFCGAIDEAAANPHLFDIINYINKAFVKRNEEFMIDIRTNGSLKTTDWWEQLAKIMPDNHKVVFGIDGSDEVSEIYRVGSSFKKVINNATAFIKAGGLADWQFIEFAHNKHQIEEAQQKSIKLGFKAFSVIASSRENESGEVHHIPIDSIKLPTNNSVIMKAEKKQRFKITCENQNPPQGKRILVNSLGLVTPCCFINGFIHMPYSCEKTYPEEDTFIWEEMPLFTKLFYKHGKDALSLHHHTLKEILAGDFFGDIEASWKTKNPIERCYEVCGKQVTDTTKFWTKNK